MLNLDKISNIKTICMKKRNKKILKNILSGFLILFLIGLIAGIFGFSIILAKYNKEIPSPNKLIERNVAQSTKIYDKTGKVLLYEIHGDQKRTIIELKDVNKNLINATIAIEDKSFYTHPGFDIKGIIRSVVKDIFTGKTQGGSTLTQQLVKNAILTNEKSFERKIKELILSYKIEKKFSKDDILKMYLNEIPYGSVVYGIESASQTFFNKSAKDLTIEESALLAALPQSPSILSPYGTHTEKLVARYKLVLKQMLGEKYISQEEYDKAIKVDILSQIKSKKEEIKAPHFVMYVKQILEEKYGENLIEQGGLSIITTLDYDKQQKAESIITKGMDSMEKNYNANNAALLSVNAKTGEIEVMVGSKDYYNTKFGNYNVTINKRQLGSTFKPIVYAAAFKKGFTPDTYLFDTLTNFNTTDGKEYIPKNYNLKEYGPVSIRKALAGSLNIPAVKTLYLTGADNVIDLAREMGYTSILQEDKNKYGLTLALGSAEESMIDHVHAFSIFANDGISNDLKTILKVTDNSGKVLEDNTKTISNRVLDKDIARQINSILSDNNARSYIFGAKNNLILKNRPVAAKTGTTNDYKDAWTIGYTPNIVTAVWVGNNDNTQMKKATGAVIGAPIWQEYMEYSTKNDKVETFQKPVYENKKNLMLNGDYKNIKKIKIDSFSGNLATESTPEDLIFEKSYIDLHDILNYINKDDLTQETVSSPEKDSQYKGWETGVKNWINTLVNKKDKTKDEQAVIDELLLSVGANKGDDIKNYLIDNSPKNIDTVHTTNSIQTLNISSPSNNTSINSTQLEVKLIYLLNNKISKVNYIIDGIIQETVTQEPFNSHILNISNIDKGYHLLEVQMFDEFLNTKSDSINFYQNLSNTSLNLQIDNKIYKIREQIPVNLLINNTKNIDTVKIFYELNNNGNKTLLSFINNPDSNSIKTTLTPENSGTYKIYAEITKKDIQETIQSNINYIQVQ